MEKERLLQQKQENLDYILKFSKITLTSICKKLNIDTKNLYHGKVSAEKILQIKLEIQKQIIDLTVTKKEG